MRLILVFLVVAVNGASAEWTLMKDEQVPGAPEKTGYVIREFRDASGGQVQMHALHFDSRHHTLRIVDSPRQHATNLGRVMADMNFVAGINGGYFTPAFEPLGLVVAGGQVAQPAIQTRLLSGVLAVTADRIFLLRNREFKLGAKTLEALQGGPFLVYDGQPPAGLNGTKRAARTFLATDGKQAIAVGVLYSPTLAAAGRLLASDGVIPGVKVRRALNFDGGRSSGFWVRTTPKPSYLSEVSSVRNFVGVLPR